MVQRLIFSCRFDTPRAPILFALALISAYLYDIYVHYLTRCVHTTERDFRPRFRLPTRREKFVTGGPLFLSVYPRRRNWFGQRRNCLFYEPSSSQEEGTSLWPPRSFLLLFEKRNREREREREGVEVKNNVFFTLLLQLPFDSTRADFSRCYEDVTSVISIVIHRWLIVIYISSRCVCVYIYIYICTHIYIDREREKKLVQRKTPVERERQSVTRRVNPQLNNKD